MNVVFVLVPLALALALFFLIGFIWSVRRGHMDDLETPAHKILMEDENEVL